MDIILNCNNNTNSIQKVNIAQRLFGLFQAAAIKALTDKFIPFHLEYLEKILNDNKSGSGYLVGRKVHNLIS